MNDRRLDAETTERILRGEAAGSPELAAVLAAASSRLAAGDPKREEAAVAAFRDASRVRRPTARRFSALLSLKAALIGLLLALTGGVAVAATAQHLPGSLGGHRHPGRGRTPATSRTYVTPAAPRASARPAPKKASPETTTHPKKPHGKAHHKRHGKPPKNHGVTGPVPLPSASLPVGGKPGLVRPKG